MKNLIALVLIACLGISTGLNAQSSEVDLLRKMFNMEKKSMAESFIQLTGSDYNAFWELYDAYEAERRGIGDKQIALLEDYADQYNSMTNDQADALVKRSLALNKSRNALLSKYYKKISKAVDAKTATSFYQFEKYINAALEYDLYDSIPFVGE